MRNNMQNIQLINFIDLTLEEKKMILEWRNDPKIRKWMYNQKEITLKEHLNFIESLHSSKDKLYFLVKKENIFIGVIDFTQLHKNESAHMGIYANPNRRGNGIILLNEIIQYAFYKLNLQKIYSEVFSQNDKAYALYKKINFKNISKKMINDKEVVCMELNYENR